MPAANYWDTSALVKLYAPEPDSAHFRSLLGTQSAIPAISFLHRVEMNFALVGKEMRGEIKPGGAALLFDAFQRHRKEGRFFEIPWGEDLEDQARLALDHCRVQSPPVPLRSLDGLHLGAILACRIQTVISTDIRLRNAAASLGLTTL